MLLYASGLFLAHSPTLLTVLVLRAHCPQPYFRNCLVLTPCSCPVHGWNTDNPRSCYPSCAQPRAFPSKVHSADVTSTPWFLGPYSEGHELDARTTANSTVSRPSSPLRYSIALSSTMPGPGAKALAAAANAARHSKATRHRPGKATRAGARLPPQSSAEANPSRPTDTGKRAQPEPKVSNAARLDACSLSHLANAELRSESLTTPPMRRNTLTGRRRYPSRP